MENQLAHANLKILGTLLLWFGFTKKQKKSYTFSIKQFDDRSFSCNHRVWSTDTGRFVSRKAPGCGGFVPMKSWETSNMAWPPGREQSNFWMGATQFSPHMINSPFIQNSQQISITFNIQITLESPHFAWPRKNYLDFGQPPHIFSRRSIARRGGHLKSAVESFDSGEQASCHISVRHLNSTIHEPYHVVFSKSNMDKGMKTTLKIWSTQY